MTNLDFEEAMVKGGREKPSKRQRCSLCSSKCQLQDWECWSSNIVRLNTFGIRVSKNQICFLFLSFMGNYGKERIDGRRGFHKNINQNQINLVGFPVSRVATQKPPLSLSLTHSLTISLSYYPFPSLFLLSSYSHRPQQYSSSLFVYIFFRWVGRGRRRVNGQK